AEGAWPPPGRGAVSAAPAPPAADAPAAQPPPAAVEAPAATAEGPDAAGRTLRVTAENLNRLLGVAGESLVESRWLKPFAGSLLRLKRLHQEIGKSLDGVREVLSGE